MPLLERGAETEALRAAAASAASGRGRLVVVEGPAGIGKTALLAVGGAAARRAGLELLFAGGGELEQEFPFGIARQLLEPPLTAADGNDDALAGGAGAAAAALGLLDADLRDTRSTAAVSGAPAETFTVVHGLHRLTTRVAARKPLALLVDDAHWADHGSLQFLAYLARRLDELPILLVVATRPRPAGAAVHAALGAERNEILLQPAPLTRAAVRRIVRQQVPDASDALCAGCELVTGGNAFYVRELARALAAGELAPDADRLRHLSPERVTRVIGARLARLDTAAREFAQALAVLGDGAPAHLCCTLAGVAPSEAGAITDTLRSAGILAAARTPAFAHPIVRTAVAAELPPGAESAAHTRAARLLAETGAAPERVAAQLLAADPGGDPWACARLVEAAAAALARGAPDAAASFGRRALAEPPPVAERAAVLLAVGTAEALALEAEPATAHLEAALGELGDRAARLQAGVSLATTRVHTGDAAGAVAALRRVLEVGSASVATTAGDQAPAAAPRATGDDALAAELEAQIVNVARFEAGTRRDARQLAERVLARARQDRAAPPAVLVCAAAELTQRGERSDEVVELCRRALAGPEHASRLGRTQTVEIAARALTSTDALPLAAQALDAELADARVRGASFELGLATAFRGEVHLLAGEIYAAENALWTAHALSRDALGSDSRWPVGLLAIVANLIRALLERGEHGEAAALVRDSGLDGPAAQLPDTYTSAMLLHARGQLATGLGDGGAAVTDLEECGRRLDDHDEHCPSLIPWRSSLSMALALDGDSGGGTALELAKTELSLARHYGVHGAIGVTLSVCAQVGPPALAEITLREAVAELRASPRRLARGHALADLGTALLASGDRDGARAALREALELAHVCGGAALEQRTLARLREAGARPRRALLRGPGALTPRERQIAELAAAGRSNREVAEAIFVTVRNVEFHLTRAYDKLGIDGREGLARALSAASPAPSPDPPPVTLSDARPRPT